MTIDKLCEFAGVIESEDQREYWCMAQKPDCEFYAGYRMLLTNAGRKYFGCKVEDSEDSSNTQNTKKVNKE